MSDTDTYRPRLEGVEAAELDRLGQRLADTILELHAWHDACGNAAFSIDECRQEGFPTVAVDLAHAAERIATRAEYTVRNCVTSRHDDHGEAMRRIVLTITGGHELIEALRGNGGPER